MMVKKQQEKTRKTFAPLLKRKMWKILNSEFQFSIYTRETERKDRDLRNLYHS